MIDGRLLSFLQESLIIEGIEREPTFQEVQAAELFLALPTLTGADVVALQAVIAPGAPMRTGLSMNVRVGHYAPPRGGPEIAQALNRLLQQTSAWHQHVAFESLHPFVDGNGRTGRLLWAWTMRRYEVDPFSLSFLQRFYYQTLRFAGGKQMLL